METRARILNELPPPGEIEKATKIAKRLYRMLAGIHPTVQGAVLADMTSMWIAGHLVEGSPEETKKLRRALVVQQFKLTVDLIKPSAEMLGTKLWEAEGGSH